MKKIKYFFRKPLPKIVYETIMMIGVLAYTVKEYLTGVEDTSLLLLPICLAIMYLLGKSE